MQGNRENFVERMKRRAVNKSFRSDTEDYFNSSSFYAYSEKSVREKMKNLSNKSHSLITESDDNINSNNNFTHNNFNKIKEESENEQENVTNTILNDSLTKELKDLSAEIAQLNFNPKVFELVDVKRTRVSKNKKKSPCAKSVYQNITKPAYIKKGNNNTEKSYKIKSTGHKQNVEDIKIESCNKNSSDALITRPQGDNKKHEDKNCIEGSGNEDDNDLNNVTFCNYEKTSTVSSYTITSDDENPQVLKNNEQRIEFITSKRIIPKPDSRIKQKPQMESKLQIKDDSSVTNPNHNKALYPDLQTHSVDELEEISRCDKKDTKNETTLDATLNKTFGMKLRQFFHPSDNKVSKIKSKNNTISNKHTPNNRFRKFADRIKNKFVRHPEQPIYVPDLNFPVSPVKYEKKTEPIQELIQELIREFTIQQTTIHQACKALMLCQIMKEFNASQEQIESEKSLLLGNVRSKATINEIDRLMSSESFEIPKKINKFDALGKIRINNIELLLKRDAVDELSKKNYTEYFVVVIIHKLIVWSSKVLWNPYDNLNVVVPDNITLSDIKHNSRIIMQIYAMKLKNSAKLSHEAKYRINGKRIKKNKFLKKHNRSISSSKIPKSPAAFITTQFELVGQLELGVEDVYLKSPWVLQNVPKTTTLQNFINFNLSCKVNLPFSHRGFVNHGYISEGHAAWDCRWCVLDKHVLKLWNYPQQEDETPLYVIDLMNCISPKVEMANQVICAKPRTIIIETISSKTNSIDKHSLNVKSIRKTQRNLFSFDTTKELNEWLSIINEVLSSLHKWNKVLYEESI